MIFWPKINSNNEKFDVFENLVVKFWIIFSKFTLDIIKMTFMPLDQKVADGAYGRWRISSDMMSFFEFF